MRAIILVGGEGTRLRPLTYTSPKQMQPIMGRPMIEWVLDHLASHGIDEVVLSLGYLPDAFVEAYPGGTYGSIKLTYAVEPERLDTAGAIGYAARFAGLDDTFVVLNGDVMTDLDLTELVRFHRDRGALATIALHEVEDPSAFGVVPTDDDGRVLAFVEKPAPGEAPTNLINAGTYVLEPSVLDLIPEGRKVSIERETFPLLVEQGHCYATPDACYWLDAGTPKAYLQAHYDFLDAKRGDARYPGATLVDGIWREDASPIAGAVSGGSYLAAEVEIAEGSSVHHSVIGAGAKIGPGARIVDAVIFPGAVIGADAVVDASIVAAGAIIGDGSTLTEVTVIGAAHQVAPGSVLTAERIPA